MSVTGFNYAYIAVLIGGNRFLWKLVERDDAVVDLLIQMESRFWQLVETRTAPDIDGSSASTELLNRLYPESKSRVIDLPMDSFKWLQQFEQAQAEEKEAALRKEEAANHLKEMLGESEQGSVKDKLGKDLRIFFPYNNSLALFKLTLSIYR
jgi:predicted phage-related endonuclease